MNADSYGKNQHAYITCRFSQSYRAALSVSAFSVTGDKFKMPLRVLATRTWLLFEKSYKLLG